MEEYFTQSNSLLLDIEVTYTTVDNGTRNIRRD